MRLLPIIILILVTLPATTAVIDQFEEYTLSEKIDAMPAYIVGQCEASVQAGLGDVREEVDARLYTFPSIIYGAAIVGVTVGNIIGITLLYIVTRKRHNRLAELNKELIKLLKERI